MGNLITLAHRTTERRTTARPTTDGESTKHKLEAVKLFTMCDIHKHQLPAYHRSQIVIHHENLKTTLKIIDRRNFPDADWRFYYEEMTRFMKTLTSPPTEEDICKAISFFQTLEKGMLPPELSKEDREAILSEHDAMKELKELDMAIIRRQWDALMTYMDFLRAKYPCKTPPSYDN